MSSNLLLPNNNEKNSEEEESNKGGYTPPTIFTATDPADTLTVEGPPVEGPPVEGPPVEGPPVEGPKGITRSPNGAVEANSYRARPNLLDESPIVAAPNNSGNYQELSNGPPPSAKKSAVQTAFTRRYGTPTPVAPSEGSSDATKKIIAIVVIGTLAAVIGVLYNQFPSYAATIMSGFVNAAMIFGGLMIVITAICIMMNVYKPDGFAITLFAGWLGMIGAWVIVPIYTVYHTFWPIEKRPYFGLFPAGFSLPGFGFIDMLLEPFHDGRDLKTYDAMLKTAHQVLYGSTS